MPILSGTELATALGLPLDANITGVAARVSASIVAYLWFDPSANALRTEYYDTLASDVLALNHGPVSSVTSVNEIRSGTGNYAQGTDPFDSTTLLVAGTDYALRTAAGSTGPVLVRLNTLWPVSSIRPVNRLAGNVSAMRGCVKVVYTTDDSISLSVAKEAAILEGIANYRSRAYSLGWVTSDSLSGASVTVSPFQRKPGGTPDTRDNFTHPFVGGMLRPFRRTAL